MTTALKPLLADLSHSYLSLDYYTAPPTAPPSINDEETSALSTSVTFPALLQFLTAPSDGQDPRHQAYTAYLVACYSPHPLTTLLRNHANTPVLNIFEASLLHALALARPFGIVTTGKYWESVLSDGTRRFLATGKGLDVPADNGSESGGLGFGNFVGVRSTGLNAAELHSTAREEVDRRIREASAGLVREGADIIILGCAGMSGMDEAVRQGARIAGKEVRIVDGVRAGVVLLEGMVRAQIS